LQEELYNLAKGPETWKDMTCLGVAEQSWLGGWKAVSRASSVSLLSLDFEGLRRQSRIVPVLDK
jgi:hypothetical protein